MPTLKDGFTETFARGLPDSNSMMDFEADMLMDGSYNLATLSLVWVSLLNRGIAEGETITIRKTGTGYNVTIESEE